MDADGNDVAGFLRKLQNLFALQEAVDKIVMGAAQSGARFILTEQLIKDLHGICMSDLLPDAGQYRKKEVKINGSPHIPPSWIDVEGCMRSFVEYINTNWDLKDLIHLSAFCMWRLNWIHPFSNGNGRVTRSLSYLILCAKYGTLLPPKNSVLEQIQKSKEPYYRILTHADATFQATSNIDVTLKPMEALLSELLKEQIKSSL